MYEAMFRGGWWLIRGGAATRRRRSGWVRKDEAGQESRRLHLTRRVQPPREERDEPSSRG